MGSVFRVLYKELFSLGTLFFIIVPFVMSMTDDYSARQHMKDVTAQTQSAITTTLNGARDNFSFAQPVSFSAGHGGNGTYVGGGPIYIPQE